jgi:hypothetical protein
MSLHGDIKVPVAFNFRGRYFWFVDMGLVQ